MSFPTKSLLFLKIFLILVLSFILLPKNTFAQCESFCTFDDCGNSGCYDCDYWLAQQVDCSGTVIDADGNPLDEVYVYIHLGEGFTFSEESKHPCFNCENPNWGDYQYATTTDSSGNWSYRCPNWPNPWEVGMIRFEKEGYPTGYWYNQTGEAYVCDTGTVALTDGWACDLPPSETVGTCSEDPDGEHGNETTCNLNCRRFRCDGVSCVPCAIFEPVEDCPYAEDPRCELHCNLSITPTPGPDCVGETTHLGGECVWFNEFCPMPPLLADGNGGCPGNGSCCVNQCNTYSECYGQNTGRGGFCYMLSWQCPTRDPWNYIHDSPIGCIAGACCVPPASCLDEDSLTPTPRVVPRPPLNPQAGCCVWEVNTAIGCVPLRDSVEFVAYVLRWALGLGGGISFFLIIFAGFLYMTSSGNPEKVISAKESFTAGASGLLLLIFSVFVLEIVIVRTFNFPTFSLSVPSGTCDRFPANPSPPPSPPPTPDPTSTPAPTSTPIPPDCVYDMYVYDSTNRGDWSHQTSLQVGDYTYGDRIARDYTLYSIPSYLLGNCWIRAANDSKEYGTTPLVRFNFNVGGDAYVYVAQDDRVQASVWLTLANGWSLLSDDIQTREPDREDEIKEFSLYRRAYSEGEQVFLGRNSVTTDPDAQSMYVVIIVPR